MVLFCAHTKSPNTTKRGFQQAQGKTPNGTFGLERGVLGRGRERGFRICDAQKLCYKALQKKRKLTKTEFTKTSGLFCQHRKGVFFLGGGWVCFLFSLLLFFFCWKMPPKGYFPADLEVFFLFCSPKRSVFKIILFFQFCFFPCFPFVFPFKIPFFFFAFYPSLPF